MTESTDKLFQLFWEREGMCASANNTSHQTEKTDAVTAVVRS